MEVQYSARIWVDNSDGKCWARALGLIARRLIRTTSSLTQYSHSARVKNYIEN